MNVIKQILAQMWEEIIKFFPKVTALVKASLLLENKITQIQIKLIYKLSVSTVQSKLYIINLLNIQILSIYRKFIRVNSGLWFIRKTQGILIKKSNKKKKKQKNS